MIDAEHKIEQSTVVMNAFGRACEAFGLNETQRAKLIGVSRATLSRNRTGFGMSTKTFELQVAFIRLYRSLYAMVGGDANAMREWFDDHNIHLQGTPGELCFSITGLVHINDYLDALRGKV